MACVTNRLIRQNHSIHSAPHCPHVDMMFIFKWVGKVQLLKWLMDFFFFFYNRQDLTQPPIYVCVYPSIFSLYLISNLKCIF